MSKILVVGNSLAVTKAISDIRQNDQESEINLFCTESVLPYDRGLLPALVAKQIKEAQTHSIAESFFKEHKVDVIANEKLLRISLKRKYVTTEKKTQIDFDQLMIADLGAVMPLTIKGHQKQGIFDCLLLSSVKALIKFLPYADSIFVMVSTIQGFDMACALHSLGKEVMIISEDSSLLGSILDDETGALLKQIAETKGIRVLTNTTIEEILGDSEMKAVKLQGGKVVAAQMLVVDAVPFDWRLVGEEGGFQKIEDSAPTAPLKPTSFGFKVLKGFCVGTTKLPAGGREYLKFDGPQNIYKKIYAHGEVLVGTVIFNSPEHEKPILKTITEGTSISGQEEALLGG